MARSFQAIFAGLDDHYGTYDFPGNEGPVAGSKFLGRAKTVKGPVTSDPYLAQQRGEGAGLGIVPIRRDHSVMWFAIDVDDYENKKPEHWSAEVERLGLPLIVCRSKSNGTHLYAFVTKPMTAAEAQKVAAKFIKTLKLPAKTEIFPKQKKLVEGGVGNWINLPYFGDTRKAVYKGRDLKLAEFLKLVASREITPSDMLGTVKEREKTSGHPGPPCIETMEQEGVPEGGRDEALFHIAVYLQRRYPDTWQEVLFDWNNEHCDPPQPYKDVLRIVNSVAKKTYQYKCNVAPMCNICDKTECFRREFGIGNDGDEAYTDYPITGLTRLLTEPVTWVAEVNGVRVKIDTKQLMDYKMFMHRVAEELRIVMPARSPGEWMKMVAELMINAEDEFVPLPVTESGQIAGIFKAWVSRNAPVTTNDWMMLEGMPFYDSTKDVVLFRGEDLISHMTAQLGPRIDKPNVWAAIQADGGVEVKRVLSGKEITLWSYPVNGQAWFEAPNMVQERF